MYPCEELRVIFFLWCNLRLIKSVSIHQFLYALSIFTLKKTWLIVTKTRVKTEIRPGLEKDPHSHENTHRGLMKIPLHSPLLCFSINLTQHNVSVQASGILGDSCHDHHVFTASSSHSVQRYPRSRGLEINSRALFFPDEHTFSRFREETISNLEVQQSYFAQVEKLMQKKQT